VEIMAASGKCPKCDAKVERLVISRVEAGAEFGGSSFAAMTLQCPSCSAVLGAQLARMFDDAGNQPRGVNDEKGNTSH
jgi:hypothetical protein